MLVPSSGGIPPSNHLPFVRGAEESSAFYHVPVPLRELCCLRRLPTECDPAAPSSAMNGIVQIENTPGCVGPRIRRRNAGTQHTSGLLKSAATYQTLDRSRPGA